jgi:hypothetical protein
MSFTALKPEDIAIQTNTIVRPMWSTTNMTNTIQPNDSNLVQNFYIDWYDSTYANNPSAKYVGLSTTVACSNSPDPSLSFNQSVLMTPAQVVFSQYKQIVFGNAKKRWTFGKTDNGPEVTDFIVFQFDRNNYKDRLQVGTLGIQLYYGGNEIFLTDNSKDMAPRYGDCGRIYDLVWNYQGNPNGATGRGETWTTYNIENGYFLGTNPFYALTSQNWNGYESFGIVCPDVGLVIINSRGLTGPPFGWDEQANTASGLQSSLLAFACG